MTATAGHGVGDFDGRLPGGAAAGASVPPLRRITVLYDANCPLCTAIGGWLARRPKHIAIDLVAAGSARARNRYPELDHERTLREITVIGDAGQIYTGAHAWVVCLWALRGHRSWAERLSTPAGLAFAKAAVVAAARVSAATRDESGGHADFDGYGNGYDGCANGCVVPG